ncbi:YozE family protein [Mediannikoviicoccus vaginalis]|uniref:YozE family protein n=1 Tax=Mediannikoviicoccus vaginalis TaxID=2899727 RepID=UPI001F2AA949|nr:YozE family protein [Mediannikoviicoccus vaginalis]
MNKINFKNWVAENSKEEFSELVKLIESDSNFPEDDNKDSILIYLRVKNISPEVLEEFEKAWEEYSK